MREQEKESCLVLERFHACLNKTEVIPEKAYRRNGPSYPLVCYINNIVGLFISRNYAVIPLFVARASEHMQQFRPSPASEAYYSLASRYLAHIVFHLGTFVEHIEFDAERVSPGVLNGGPQVPPVNQE